MEVVEEVVEECFWCFVGKLGKSNGDEARGKGELDKFVVITGSIGLSIVLEE